MKFFAVEPVPPSEAMMEYNYFLVKLYDGCISLA
jgi:hypothetical protein